ncbi:MAG: hypothetical protein WBW33_33265 [Bryobacteraceae bacterium]
MAEQIYIAEMMGDLLAAGSCLPTGFGLGHFQENTQHLRKHRLHRRVVLAGNGRHWIREGSAPRMDSLVLLALSHGVSMLSLLSEKIAVAPALANSNHSLHAHFRVPDLAVEEALGAALSEDTPPSLLAISARLGYRTIVPLQNRYRGLCNQIVAKRKWLVKMSPPPVPVPIPRARIEAALAKALIEGVPISMESIAASIGLKNKRRLYKSFHDLRNAIIANNRRFRQERSNAMEHALRAAFAETPVPTVTEVARRLGFKFVTPITKRFPDLSLALRQKRRIASTI